MIKKNNIAIVILGIFIIASISCVKSPSSVLRKDLKGFGNIEWGQDVSTLEEMVCIKNKHPLQKICIKKDENLKIGKADLEAIEYYFWDGRFYSAKIIFKGKENFSQLKKQAFNTYGKGIEQKVYNGFGYSWDKEKIGINLGYLEDYQKGTLSVELKEVASTAHQRIMKDLLAKGN